MSELLLSALTAAIVSSFWLDRAGPETPRAIAAALAVGAAVWAAFTIGAAVETGVDRAVLARNGVAYFAPLVSLTTCVASALVVARLPLPHRDVLRAEVWLVTAAATLLATGVRHATSVRGTGLITAIVGAGAVFFIALALLRGVYDRLDRADVPKRLRGPALRLVAAALLSLAFMGFVGVAGL